MIQIPISLLMSPSIPLLHGNPQLRHQSTSHQHAIPRLHTSFPSFDINSPNRHSPSSQCRPASGQTRSSPCSTTHASSSSLPRLLLLLLLLLPRGGPHPPPCYCRTPRSAPTGPGAPFLASASCLSGVHGRFFCGHRYQHRSRSRACALGRRACLSGTGRGGGGVGECAADLLRVRTGVSKRGVVKEGGKGGTYTRGG
jgi:hypothetical protein